MIYHDPDDPERGYFTEDEVIPCSAELGCTGWVLSDPEDDASVHVAEAPCSICGANTPEATIYPLCTTCELTARAHAKLETDARRYPDPERTPA